MKNNTQTQKDILDLSEEEFISFFKEKIGVNYEKLSPPKKIRPSKSLQIGCLSIAFSPFFIVGAIFIFSQMPKNALVFLPILILYLFLVFKVFFPDEQKRNLVDIKEEILNILGLNYVSCDCFLSKENEKLHNICEKILREMFGSIAYIEDMLQGRYKNIYFSILDIIEKGAFAGLHRTCIFFKINKKFYSELYLRDKKSILRFGTKTSAHYNESINLEDVSFTQEYKVYAQDQVEARYLLTPTFMERLLKYREIKKSPIEVIFTPRYFGFLNLFFYIESDKDIFRVPYDSQLPDTVTTAKYFYKFLQEIKKIIDIVDALKLDQDIGM